MRIHTAALFTRLGLPGGRKAVVLVLTLWVVVVLGVIAASLAFDVQVGSKLTLLQREQFVAYNLAKSAVAAGMTHLQNDILIEQQENPNQLYDAFSDVWAQPGVREKDIEIEIDKDHEDRTYEFQIADEEGKIPLNQASPRVLKAMLEYYGYEAPDSDDVAAAIVDYRDQDDMSAGAPGEKENEHYSVALGQKVSQKTLPDELAYRCPNEPFLTIEQLLDVYGIDPGVYYGYDPEEKEEKELKIRNAGAQGRRTAVSRDRKRKEEPLALKDIVTVLTPNSGKVNINTAPVEVLTILIHAATNFASIDASRTTAESIVEFRGTAKKGKAPNPEDAFKSLPDLGKVPGVNMDAFNQMGGMGIQPAFSSGTFSITGIGRTARAVRTITAVVERKMEVYNPDDARLAGKSNSKRDRPKIKKERRGSVKAKGEQNDNYIRIPAIRIVQWTE